MPQPKSHKYNRKQRLLHAKNWITKYDGKRIHYGYAKHFGVSKLCAVTELEMLGIILPPKIKEDLKLAEENKRKQHERLKLKKEESFIESDFNFAFIVGYTSGGAPYGITWEEMKESEQFDDKREISLTDVEEVKDLEDFLNNPEEKRDNNEEVHDYVEDHDNGEYLPF